MKVSVVTITFNSGKTLKDTIESVLSQDYPDVEYIIADGLSSDNTVDILKSYGERIIWKSEKDKGIYDAMSKGVAMASGDIIGIINSDDFYPDNGVISRVVNEFRSTGADAVYGDLQYVDHEDTSRIVRNWVSGAYDRERFLLGWMPPHPTFFLKKSCYERFGTFNPAFKSAGDYELMLRMLYKHHLSAAYVPQVQMKMRTGGVSNVSLKNRWRANREDKNAWKINGLKPRWYTFILKPLSKIFQFLT